MAKEHVRASTPAAAATFADRRKSARAELVVRVDYQTVDDLFSEFARNINEGGIFVETESPQPVGTEVALQFKLPGSDEANQTRGLVVRISGGEAGEPPGMGIEFGHLDASTRTRINRLVRRLRTPQ
jgi:type IV pilus assembly protein PilZ